MTPWTAVELRRRCEEGRVVGCSTNTALAVTGEPYVIIGSQAGANTSACPGTVDEGQPHELGFEEEDAFWLALNSFQEYAVDRAGILYWRIPPTFEEATVDGVRRTRFYMRCLISDKLELLK